MAQVEIRRLKGDNILKLYYPMMDYAFGGSPQQRNPEEDQKRLHFQDENQIYALFEDDYPVASATIVPMTQHVRGKVFEMGGVQGVATYPQARRKGYAKQLLEFLLKKMKEQNQPVSSLYPFRESFYERLGYALLPQSKLAVFAPGTLHHLLGRDLPGTVQMMDIQTGFERYTRFLYEVQRRTHGISLYPDTLHRRMREDNNHWLAIAVDAHGQDIGILLYRITDPDTNSDKRFKGLEFLYQNSIGKYLLLSWLARHVDQTPQIELQLAPGEHAELWWNDLDVRVYTPRDRGGFMTPMGRVVMVEGLAGMEVGEGKFAANIHDRQCPWNSSVYTFASQDGKLVVAPAESRAAQCDLQIQGLSALVYTGSDPADFEWRGWGNPSPEIQRIMQQMFPPMQPYVLKFF